MLYTKCRQIALCAKVQFLKVKLPICLFAGMFSMLYISHTCMLASQDDVLYNLTLPDSKWSALLLAQEWLERQCFNGTKVQWFSLMHGNGCQQAFSCCTTIRALSLVGGWPASHRTELQCCQVYHLWGWQHISVPKISGLVLTPKS